MVYVGLQHFSASSVWHFYLNLSSIHWVIAWCHSLNFMVLLVEMYFDFFSHLIKSRLENKAGKYWLILIIKQWKCNFCLITFAVSSFSNVRLCLLLYYCGLIYIWVLNCWSKLNRNLQTDEWWSSLLMTIMYNGCWHV